MSNSTKSSADLDVVAGGKQDFVTIFLSGQWVGIPVLAVHDVLNPQPITPIPHSDPAVAGVLNLRGRIVTAVDLRVQLGFEARDPSEPHMSVVVEYGAESYSLLIDKVGDVVSVPDDCFEKNPVTLDERLRNVSNGVYRLEEGLLVVLDVARLLDFGTDEIAA